MGGGTPTATDSASIEKLMFMYWRYHSSDVLTFLEGSLYSYGGERYIS